MEEGKIKTRIAGMIVQDGKLLMLTGKGHSKELWTPGGKIDEGESDEECLKRELNEELGVELVKATFFKSYTTPSFYNNKDTTIQRVYMVEIKGEPVPSAEIDTMIWFTKEEYENKKYPMITMTQEELIPDMIKAGLW